MCVRACVSTRAPVCQYVRVRACLCMSVCVFVCVRAWLAVYACVPRMYVSVSVCKRASGGEG